MSGYEDNLLAARFAALAPEPLAGDWGDVLERAGRARKGGRRLGSSALQGRWSLRRMTPRRRFATAVVFACAISLALLAAIMLSDSPGVLERAQAALAPNGRILHMVTDDRTTIGESWSLPDGSLWHVTYRGSSEAFGSDCVISETTTRCWNPTSNTVDVYRHWPPEPGLPLDEPQFRIDQPQTLSQALGSGYARLLGETTFEGRPVIAVLLAAWTTHSPPPQFLKGSSHTVYLDRKTYLPVAERVPEDGSTINYKTFEFLPATAENRKAIELPASVGARVVIHPVGEYPPEGK